MLILGMILVSFETSISLGGAEFGEKKNSTIGGHERSIKVSGEAAANQSRVPCAG